VRKVVKRVPAAGQRTKTVAQGEAARKVPQRSPIEMQEKKVVRKRIMPEETKEKKEE